MLIGICGKAGSGKDTIGDYLVEKHGYEKIALAAPIKRLVQDIFVLTDEELNDREIREQPMPDWDNWSVRRLLQFIGTEMFRKNLFEDIWVRSLCKKVCVNKDKNHVVTDVRFPNELNHLKDNMDDFLSIKVIRDGCDGSVGIQGHESEKYDLDADHIVENNGSYADLFLKIDKIIGE
jgi:hypothetical protein